LKTRLAQDDRWFEFEGTCRAWEILGGAGNVEDQFLDDPNGAYRAGALRTFDPDLGRWSILWIDARSPQLDPPVCGGFHHGVGTFLGHAELRGQPIAVRFIWSHITETSARWEQAFSPDDGASWELNWVMTFDRVR